MSLLNALTHNCGPSPSQAQCAVLALSGSSRPGSGAGCPQLLRSLWLRHLAFGASAVTSFGLEDALSGCVLGPLAHASWHCLAATAMLTAGPVLMHRASAGG